ncbi:hypothetical protein SGRA_2014 [Saprospira grandis str. Lewin]|uniref:Uncharacterized protein n=1 Tax=Saprospira grandis (strain Lewin) TaxID=984262 RepID=H6L2A7_SAPGL|nr:hypothetical protein SGRA_2014 [Saprospira grandis str. Lewin]
MIFFHFVYLGLPQPSAGSGHCAARKSARPCSPSGFGLPPSAALLQPLSRVAALLCGGFAAC